MSLVNAFKAGLKGGITPYVGTRAAAAALGRFANTDTGRGMLWGAGAGALAGAMSDNMSVAEGAALGAGIGGGIRRYGPGAKKAFLKARSRGGSLTRSIMSGAQSAYHTGIKRDAKAAYGWASGGAGKAEAKQAARNAASAPRPGKSKVKKNSTRLRSNSALDVINAPTVATGDRLRDTIAKQGFKRMNDIGPVGPDVGVSPFSHPMSGGPGYDLSMSEMADVLGLSGPGHMGGGLSFGIG